jgi:hypothetical protein
MRAGDLGKPMRVVLAAAVLLVALVLLFPHLHGLAHRYRFAGRLGSHDGADRLRAAMELGRLRDERAISPLVSALATGEVVVNRPEDEVAILCGIGGSTTVQVVEQALRDPASDRGRLIEVLACLDDAAARAVLVKSLASQDRALLQTTVLVLSESRDPRLVGLLADAETHATPAARLQIIASLTPPAGSPLDSRLSSALVAALSDPDAEVRRAAADSLTWNYLNRAIPAGALADAVRHKGLEVRNAVSAKLASYRPALAQDATLQALLAGYARPDAPVNAPNDDLAVSARRASAFIAARQDPGGYWLTARTRSLRSKGAGREMNTYLTPLLVDVLAPVADKAALGGPLASARRQIGGEIEDSGIVRYYGHGARASGQGRICAIAPDADDTALAWRIAPNPDARKLQTALASLRLYRASNGLYRTWLAPLDRLDCVDRGHDPDPTDAGIQMHILMFLARASPADARALCTALAKNIADDRIWVYYPLEPLVPIIRQADLKSAGCGLDLPARRLRTDVPGQGQWVVAALALRRLLQEGDPDPSQTTALLRKLAQGDFWIIRRSPPLVYQNDATGSAPGFYWSQEFGYALWLRLYFENLLTSQHPVASGHTG